MTRLEHPVYGATMNPDTPGNQTSEYRLTVAGAVVSFVITLVGLIHPGFKVKPEVQSALVGQLAIVVPALIGFYTASRGKVKQASIVARGALVAARDQ